MSDSTLQAMSIPMLVADMSVSRLQNPNHTHTPIGNALYLGINACRVNDKFQEPLYLALELARAGVLHGDLWSGKAYSGGPSFGSRESAAWQIKAISVC